MAGGIAYIAIPDKRFTVDYRRTTMDWKHVLEDFQDGAEHSREMHYLDWTRNVTRVGEQDIEATTSQFMNKHYSIHFHAWSTSSLVVLFEKCRTELGFLFTVGDFVRNVSEVIVVLKKLPVT